MTIPQRRRVLLVALAVVVLAGCSSLANLNIPTPPPGSPSLGGSATTTPVTDYTGIALPVLPSAPPTSVALTPGTATLQGIVTGPSGVVGGATVLVQRVVDGIFGSKTVVTSADGLWRLTGILGGVYEVRAWQAPDLAMTAPQVLELGAGGNQNVNLTVLSFNGQSVSASVVPSPPQVGQPATLTLQATQETVGSDGVIRGSALPGASISVIAAGNVVLAGANPGTTGPTGQLVLSLACSSVGPVGLTATVDGLNSYSLSVPDCAVAIPTITTPGTIFAPTTT